MLTNERRLVLRMAAVAGLMIASLPAAPLHGQEREPRVRVDRSVYDVSSARHTWTFEGFYVRQTLDIPITYRNPGPDTDHVRSCYALERLERESWVVTYAPYCAWGSGGVRVRPRDSTVMNLGFDVREAGLHNLDRLPSVHRIRLEVASCSVYRPTNTPFCVRRSHVSGPFTIRHGPD